MRGIMRFVFINKDREMRSGWKIGLALVAILMAVLLVSFSLSLIIGLIINVTMLAQGATPEEIWYNQPNIDPLYFWIMGVMQPLCVIFVIFVAVKLLSKKKLSHIGFTSIRTCFKDLAYGLLFGAVSIAAVFAGILLLAPGSITVKSGLSESGVLGSFVGGLILFILVGINEEMFARGYCITALNQMRLPWLSVLLSSLLFSVMHAGNPNTSPIGYLNLFLVGVLFGMMFLKTGNLWMPIGYHITWNFFQGNVFGFAVSGLEQKGLMRVLIDEENIINGGYFGPEGGILTTAVIAIGMVLIMLAKYKDTKSPMPAKAQSKAF